MGIGETFVAGGLWMYPITLLGVITTIYVILQFKRIETVDYSRLLWALLAAMVMMGALATLIGLTHAWTAIGLKAPLEEIPGAVLKAGGIAIIPTEHALILGIPLTILIGITRHLRRRIGAKTG